MKKVLILFFLSSSMFFCMVSQSYAKSVAQEKTTSNSSTKIPKSGQIVAYFDKDGALLKQGSKNAYSYRKYQGKDKKGDLIVQDFYVGSGKKLSNTFLITKFEYLKSPQRMAFSEFPFFPDPTISGHWVTWYENGQKAYEGRYVQGNLEGVQTLWHSNGQKKSEGKYVNGSAEGIHTSWHSNGQEKSEGNYVNDQIEGLHVVWHENGQKANEAKFIKGNPEGMYTHWYDNGQKRDEIKYVNGKSNGTHTSWHQNGQKSFQGKEINFLREGIHTWWDAAGNITKECLYKNDEEVRCNLFK